MTQQIVNTHNVNELDFSVLVELLSPIYTKEIPEMGTNIPMDAEEVQRLLIFFTNQHAYMVELWGTMLYNVRVLKRAEMKVSEAIDDAMAKRDYIDKIISACKLKADKCSVLLRYSGGSDAS